jgi:hypothetical protein
LSFSTIFHLHRAELKVAELQRVAESGTSAQKLRIKELSNESIRLQTKASAAERKLEKTEGRLKAAQQQLIGASAQVLFCMYTI